MSQVKLAFAEYVKGNYATASEIYKRLGKELGIELFKTNIHLCESRLLKCGYVKPALDECVNSEENQNVEVDVVHQLAAKDVVKVAQKNFSSYEFPIVGDRLVVEFKVVSEAAYSYGQVIFGVDIFDSAGRLLDCESYRSLNYSRSEKFGMYKYLSANSDGTEYVLAITLPSGAERCIVRLGAKGNSNIYFINEPLIKFYNGAIPFELYEIFENQFKLVSLGDVRKHFSEINFNVSHAHDILLEIEKIPATVKSTAAIFWYLWELTNDPFLFEMARQRLVFQGRMYELRKLLNQWDEKTNFKNGKNSAKRIDDEIFLLESGLSLPRRINSQKYNSKNDILYLLHNRLPYNSGGYATRTHGLLTGIKKHSNYKMHGVSRPGYPSDHVQHISKPLPSPIPEFDVIDGIEYFALSQSIRRSSLTTTEYIENYAQEVEVLAREKRVGIIHAAANFPNGLAASLAARRLGIKSVYEVRGLWEITRLSRQEGWDETDQFRFMAKMEADACNAADAVITITEALKDLMISRGVDGRKITVVPNCVHTDLFQPLEKNRQLAEILGLADNDIVIGYIGSIVNYEGLDDLLDALALLIKEGITNFKFLLVGDGAALDDLKQQVMTLRLDKYVVITGRVPHDEVQRYYSLIDIAPFPRKPYLVCEAVSPLKPFEAMASQKSVIVSSCAALTEIVNDGFNGLVFEKGNIISLKEVLKKLINDHGLREQISKNGREWVIKERDWSSSSKIVAGVYNNLNRSITY